MDISGTFRDVAYELSVPNALLQLSENIRGANIFMTLLIEGGYQFAN